MLPGRLPQRGTPTPVSLHQIKVSRKLKNRWVQTAEVYCATKSSDTRCFQTSAPWSPDDCRQQLTTTIFWTILGSEGLYKSGENIVNVLNCEVYQAGNQGEISVQVDSGTPQVRYIASVHWQEAESNPFVQLLMPASSLDQHGALCSSVATGTGNSEILTSTTVTQASQTSWTVIGATFLVLRSVLFLL
jgi:Domain of unknown function (DUF1966)